MSDNEKLLPQIVEILEFDIDELVHDGLKVGDKDVSFSDCKAEFERMFDIAVSIATVDLDGIPQNVIGEANNVAIPLQRSLKNIKDFEINPAANSAAVRDQDMNDFRPHYEAYSMSRGDQQEHYEQKAQESLDEMGRLQAEMGESLEAANKERENLTEKYEKDFADVKESQTTELTQMAADMKKNLQELREAVGAKGVAEFSDSFDTQANKHTISAYLWLVSASAFGIVLGCLAYYFVFCYEYSAIVDGGTVQRAVSKVVLFSVLWTGLIWSGRNYRAHRHNAVSYKHKSVAIESFRAFAAATDDKATKDAVLIRTTESIFSPTPSGYLSKEPEHKGISKILELVRKD